jgi:hypothetical protein
LDWVFSKVEEAIILEDDCVPHPSFFRFCGDLLERYRYEERIMMISGGNYQNGVTRTPYSYYFSKFFHIWGWATWRRAWTHYDIEMRRWPELRESQWLMKVLGDETQARTFRKMFNDMEIGGDGWAYRWVFTCWRQNALSIVPSKNIVTNIGFPKDRADIRYHPFGHLPIDEMFFPLKHPPFIERQIDADKFEHRKEYGGLRGNATLRRFLQEIAYYRKNPAEILMIPYQALRAVTPSHVRSGMRRRLGLPPNGPFIEGLMDRYWKKDQF